MWADTASMLCEQTGPDMEMPVFHVRQSSIDVLLGRVGLRIGQQTIQERGVGLILPVMLEGIEIGCAGLRRLRRGDRSHTGI